MSCRFHGGRCVRVISISQSFSVCLPVLLPASSATSRRSAGGPARMRRHPCRISLRWAQGCIHCSAAPSIGFLPIGCKRWNCTWRSRRSPAMPCTARCASTWHLSRLAVTRGQAHQPARTGGHGRPQAVWNCRHPGNAAGRTFQPSRWRRRATYRRTPDGGSAGGCTGSSGFRGERCWSRCIEVPHSCCRAGLCPAGAFREAGQSPALEVTP